MVSVVKATNDDLDRYKIAPGFVKWVSSHDEKGREELKELLKSKMREGMEVWIAVDKEEVVGFTIVSDWPVLPGAKAIEAMEVAKPFRGKGIGSMMLSKVIKEYDTLIALMPSPEEGYEKELEKFYERFGFRYLTSDYMVRIPDSQEAGYKLRKWIHQIDRLLEIYQVLLKEMKVRHDAIYERGPRLVLERERRE